MKRLLPVLVLILAAGPLYADTFSWSGTASGYYHENLTACFDPNGVGTTISGTLDISNLAVGGVEMFGLIDKKLKDANGYMWQSGAYMYVYKTASGVQIGTSDGNLGGEITTDATSVGATDIVDFSMTIQSGQIDLTSSLFSGTKSRSYGVVKTLNNGYGYAWDEFAEGAYLGGSLYASGSFDYDVTATNARLCPVPEPVFFQFGALMGLSGLGVLKLRRR